MKGPKWKDQQESARTEAGKEVLQWSMILLQQDEIWTSKAHSSLLPTAFEPKVSVQPSCNHEYIYLVCIQAPPSLSRNSPCFCGIQKHWRCWRSVRTFCLFREGSSYFALPHPPLYSRRRFSRFTSRQHCRIPRTRSCLRPLVASKMLWGSMPNFRTCKILARERWRRLMRWPGFQIPLLHGMKEQSR